VTPVRPIRVVFDAQFSAESSYGTLSAIGDALMEALIHAEATDPFVAIDAGTGSLLVEVVVEAESQAGALTAGAAVIDTALRAAGVEQRAAPHGSTARTEDPIPVGGQDPARAGCRDDLKDLLGRLREIGASQQGEVRDVGGGKLVGTLTDPDGNVFGLSQGP